MKRRLLSFLILCPISIYGQYFSTKFTFVDAKNNTDSITVGYSPNATDSLDISLGEKNLTDTQIDTTFCVYVSDIIALNSGEFSKPSYKTKKQIVHLIKSEYLRFACIDIIIKNFPLTIKWDKSQFQDTSRSNSFIIATAPGGWFDVGEDPHKLSLADSIIYTEQGIKYGNYYYDSIQNKDVKVWKLYIGFASKKEWVDIINIQNINNRIFPNPCQNTINITQFNNKPILVQLYDLAGRMVLSYKLPATDNNIDLSKLKNGFYLLKIIEDQKITTYKILKK